RVARAGSGGFATPAAARWRSVRRGCGTGVGAGSQAAEGVMNEATRHEIVQRRQTGTPVRAIARELGITRGAVTRALARVQAQRAGRAAPSPRPRPRRSIIDPFEPILKELLAKYPHLTNERALQELRARGFRG